MTDVRLAGYASVFGVTDGGGDVVMPGAFDWALADPPKRVPLLWQHDAREPIGFVESMNEDQRGLRVVARVVDAGRGAGVARLLAAGAIDGLSFGYRVKAARRLARTGSGAGSGAVRALERVELVEVSVVTFPMQPLARVLAVVEVAKGDE